MTPRSTAAPAALALAMALALGCRGSRDDAPRAASTTAASAASVASAAVADATALMPDDAVGPLLARLSETPGDFPSENYVTNETSLLHVAPALRDPRLRGRAYVGVGPEQSYTYLALLEPRVAYIVDIRRGNFLEHMMFRGCFEAGRTRAEFLGALLARRAAPVLEGADAGADLASLEAAFRAAAPEAALREEGVARTRALMDRLGVVRAAGDDKAIARIHEAFAKHGLAIAYTMLNSDRKYPTLGENLAARDPDGAPASFLASEETYARVRRMVIDNRVLPVVGDFGGKHALRSVAEDMRARGVTLGVFYTSNVEQYLFEQKTYGAFVESVRAMPSDDASLLVRVWFDAGKPHPAQRPGHRTTQLAFPVSAFLARAANKPFHFYWDVVNQTAE
ncbi:MAG TPA: hypothetical protein VLT33_21665 [Labilithrix sp.]|nr:hypothetical protein [Labilithrix sp.]